MSWQILDTGKASARKNMSIDKDLLDGLAFQSQPLLRWYDWEKPSLTIGYFIDPSNLLNISYMDAHGLDWAKRPTGGGVVFHLWDLTFSILIPAKTSLFSLDTLKNYQTINEVVRQTLQEFLGDHTEIELRQEEQQVVDPTCSYFCMSKISKYDVESQQKKMGGGAQRKTKDGFLHQATISLMVPDQKLLQNLIKSSIVQETILMTSALIAKNQEEFEETKRQLRKLLTKRFSQL